MTKITPMVSEETLSTALRELYRSYGYRQYRMSRFEEYDLYVENKAFLRSDNIITFNDLDGRLMALKPDVTLSIARKAAPAPNTADKVFYHENVFRADQNTHEYKEIQQIGLEAIGAVDGYVTGEAVALALQSLALISPDHLLDLSHPGFLAALLASVTDSILKERIIECVRQKNTHDLKKLCQTAALSEDLADRLCKLASLYGPFAQVLPVLSELTVNEDSAQALKELSEVCDYLVSCGLSDRVNLDFSLVNDLNYYNGIIFQGYVDNLPDMVLSGGRYDNLMRRWGRGENAVGFAIYLPALQNLLRRRPDYDVDLLITYEAGISVAALGAEVQKLRSEGCSLQVQRDIPGGLRYRRHLHFTQGGLKDYE